MRHRWGDGRACPVSRPRPVCSGPGSNEGRPVVPQAEAPPGMRSPGAEGVGGQKSQRLPQCPALGGHLSAPCEEQRKRRPLCFEDDVESRVPPMTPNPRLVSQTEQGWPVTVPVGTAVGRAGRVWRESDRESELEAVRAVSSSPVFRRGRCRPTRQLGACVQARPATPAAGCRPAHCLRLGSRRARNMGRSEYNCTSCDTCMKT